MKPHERPKIQVLRPSNPTRPLVYCLWENGKGYVIKDFSQNRPIFARVVGRFLLYREAKALRALSGIRGVPEFKAWVKELAIATEAIEGITLEAYEKERRLDQEFFQRLEALITEIHSRGVAHCDLKRAANILVGIDKRPYIVDWSSAIFRNEFPFLLRPIYERFLKDDRVSLVKFKLRHIPNLVTEKERLIYLHRGRIERLIRHIRDWLRGLLQGLVR